jgi:anti-anti-sigma regulatory factor
MRLAAAPHSKEVVVLEIEGSVDGDSYGQLLVEAQGHVARNVRVLAFDLSHCTYMSSAGIVVLTTLYKQMRELNRSEASASWATKNVLERAGELGPQREIVLVNPTPAVRQVLDMAGIPSYIPVYASVQDAIGKT